MDDFFTKQFCDRCGKDISSGRIMSMFNEDCICLDCKAEEKKLSNYKEAVKADHKEIANGNYNFKGIGYNK